MPSRHMRGGTVFGTVSGMVFRRRRSLVVWLLLGMPILWFLLVIFFWGVRKGIVKGEEREELNEEVVEVKVDVNVAQKKHAVSIVKDEEAIDEKVKDGKVEDPLETVSIAMQ